MWHFPLELTNRGNVAIGSGFNSPAMKSGMDENLEELYIGAATFAHQQILIDVGMKDAPQMSKEDVKNAATIAAKIAFDFADAFMRERYERLSVANAFQQPTIQNRING